MNKKIRWGLLCASRIARTFIADMQYVTNGEVVAIATRKPADANAFAQEYDIKRAYAGYDAMLADPDIDAVYISSPHSLHYQHTKAAILAGKSVLCEKPFTVGAEQAIELQQLARQHQVYVMEAMWTYFLPAIKQAKQWVEEGRIGQVVQIDADFGYPIPYSKTQREYNKDLGGGCLLEMGIYPVALAYLFTKQQPDKIYSVSRLAPNGVEDDVKMLLQYQQPSGQIAVSLSTSFIARLSNCAYIVGTEGYISIPDFFRARECRLHVLDEQVEHFFDPRKGSGFEFEIQAVGDDLLNQKQESAVMPLHTSVALQQMMSAIKKTF
ncbi:Gfo/Idh/MocA family protein [Thalassotalea aquiviva]|uniref:Gfo/Idh/MocA family protein n=1 Tax=Thalassotalea aquiviva TaxID=3242415 RepID=UPI00352A35A7